MPAERKNLLRLVLLVEIGLRFLPETGGFRNDRKSLSSISCEPSVLLPPGQIPGITYANSCEQVNSVLCQSQRADFAEYGLRSFGLPARFLPGEEENALRTQRLERHRRYAGVDRVTFEGSRVLVSPANSFGKRDLRDDES